MLLSFIHPIRVLISLQNSIFLAILSRSSCYQVYVRAYTRCIFVQYMFAACIKIHVRGKPQPLAKPDQNLPIMKELCRGTDTEPRNFAAFFHRSLPLGTQHRQWYLEADTTRSTHV